MFQRYIYATHIYVTHTNGQYHLFLQYYEQQSEIARYRPDIKPIGAETIVEECKTLARTNAVPYQAPGVGGALMVESSYNDTSNTIPAFLDAGDTEKSQ